MDSKQKVDTTKHITYAGLKASGYEIDNAKIEKVSISMEDHGCLVYAIVLKGYGWECTFGGVCIGHGYLGASDFDAKGSHGLEAMMRIMNTVGVSRWEDLNGKVVRCAYKAWGDRISIIGNIIDDRWFNQKEFFNDPENYGRGVS